LWHDDEYSKVLEQRKQAHLQWLQDGDNLNNGMCESSRIFNQIKKEYLKNKTNELKRNNKD
jgi:hypothetical protein